MNKTWLRYASLLLFLVLQCFLLLGILLATRLSTDSVVQGHVEEVMTHVVSNVTGRTRALLEPAETSISLTTNLLQTEQINALDNQALESYFISQLVIHKQFAGMYFARSDGSFVFVNRNTSFTSSKGATSVYRTKIIQSQPSRSVEITFKDGDGTILNQFIDTQDSFDPRLRPWYVKAEMLQQSKDMNPALNYQGKLPFVWTSPYIFFSSKKPGITVANLVQSATAHHLGTLGIDIELSDLSHYLGMISQNQNKSFAFLKTTDDILVAFPELESYLRSEEPQSLPKISDIQNTISDSFLMTVDEVVTDGSYKSGSHLKSIIDFKVDNEPFIGTLQPITVIGGQKWLLGIHAPKDVYVGNIMSRFNKSMWQILTVGLLFSLMVIPFSYVITRPLRRLHTQATTDALTGLYDRSEFMREAKSLQLKATRSGKKLVFIMIDLDNFKPINDIYGHHIGDEVLVLIARRLQDAVKANDLVARFGGDEFAICLYDVDPKDARAVVERIRKVIEGDGISSSEGFHPVGVTAGAVLSQEKLTPETLLAHADGALVAGKVTRKGRSYFADIKKQNAATAQRKANKKLGLNRTDLDVAEQTGATATQKDATYSEVTSKSL